MSLKWVAAAARIGSHGRRGGADFPGEGRWHARCNTPGPGCFVAKTPGSGTGTGSAGAGGPWRHDEIARALGRPAATIEFVPPEHGAALSGKFEERRAAFLGSSLAGVPLVTSTRDRAVLEGILAWLAGQVPQQEAILLRPASPASGGARTTATEVLERALDLLGLDPAAEVRAISPDAAFGLGLAVVGEGPGEEEETIYRLVSWGFRPAGLLP
jgi:hypothetical protein